MPRPDRLRDPVRDHYEVRFVPMDADFALVSAAATLRAASCQSGRDVSIAKRRCAGQSLADASGASN